MENWSRCAPTVLSLIDARLFLTVEAAFSVREFINEFPQYQAEQLIKFYSVFFFLLECKTSCHIPVKGYSKTMPAAKEQLSAGVAVGAYVTLAPFLSHQICRCVKKQPSTTLKRTHPQMYGHQLAFFFLYGKNDGVHFGLALYYLAIYMIEGTKEEKERPSVTKDPVPLIFRGNICLSRSTMQ